MLNLRGLFVAIVTPFKEVADRLVIDYETLATLIEFHVKAGTTGIVVGGCTGESFVLTPEEQMELIRFVIEKVAGRMTVVPGTGSNSTAEAIALTACAAEAGADCAMLISPYANKPGSADQTAHVQAILKAVPTISIMLYDVPSRTGIKMQPEDVAHLFNQHERVVAIKAASGDLNQVSQIAGMCDIIVLSGDDPLTIPMLAIGAQGVVSVTANIAPDKVAEPMDAFWKGDVAEATKLHLAMHPLHQALFWETNPKTVKAAMKLMDLLPEAHCRLPLTGVQANTHDRLRSLLTEQGLIEA